MSDQNSDSGSMPPARSGIPLGALIGIGVIAVVGLALLIIALLNVFNSGTPVSQATATQAPTRVVVIPTTTVAAPPTNTNPPPPTDTVAAPVASDTAAAPQATTAPTGPVLSVFQPANVRSGPGINYTVIGGLQTGATTEAVGRDSTGTWFVINYGGGRGWISNIVANYSGDVNALPVVQAPPPPATAVPPTVTGVPPTATGAPGGSGVRGDYFRLQTTAREFAVNQDIWFEFKVTNTSANSIPYRCLGAKVSGVGAAQCSWGSSPSDSLSPNGVIEWNDHINIGTPGTYTLVLGFCTLGDTSACQNSVSNGWQILSSGIQITVR
ncbi:MAG: SH3 domain-containing protein [Anaerolineales bacterium]